MIEPRHSIAGEERRPSVLHVARFVGIAVIIAMLAMITAVGVVTTALPGCAGCHFEISDFRDATLSTVHTESGTPCVACHVESGQVLARTKWGFYQVFGMWLPVLSPSSTDVTLVRDSRCLSCHQSVMGVPVEVRGVRIAHATCTVGRVCVDCHSEVGHAEATSWPRVASMNDCTSCHRSMRVSLECETCHAGRMASTRSSLPEFGVTHGPTWEQTHGMGDMGSCLVCHAEDACMGCHGPGVPHPANFLQSHAAVSIRGDAACLSCHDDTFCYSCHLTEMPHPEVFVRGHAVTVEQDGDRKSVV